MRMWACYMKILSRGSSRTIVCLLLASFVSFECLTSALAAQASGISSGIQIQICGLIGIISSVIGILAIFLFVFGAVLYAVAHMLPAAGNIKGSAQGWGMGMLIGGVIGIILYLLSSFIIYRLASFSTGGAIPAITQVDCNTLGSAASSGSSAAASSGSASSNSASSNLAAASQNPSIGSISDGGLAAINGRNSPTLSLPGQPYQCALGEQPSQIPNGDFSTGNYLDWNESGSGFGSSPLDLISANGNGQYYSSPWSGYLGEYLATTFNPGAYPSTGSLISAPFMVTAPYLNFRIVSPANRDLYVELLINKTVFLVDRYNTTNGVGSHPLGTFANASIYLGPLACREVSVGIVSQVYASKANESQFIAAGDFRLGNHSTATLGILTNSTVT